MLPRVLCLSPATFRVRYMSLHSREKGEEEEDEEDEETKGVKVAECTRRCKIELKPNEKR